MPPMTRSLRKYVFSQLLCLLDGRCRSDDEQLIRVDVLIASHLNQYLLKAILHV
ncbi:hypothetical protein PALA111701_25010 [Paenibacillus lactis]